MASDSSKMASDSSLMSFIDEEEHDIINSLINCPICMEQFRVPKVLPCHHTFCLECLYQHYDATNAKRPRGPVSNFPCPNCRRVCYIPKDGLQYLVTDFKVSQIHDLIGKMQEKRKAARVEAAALAVTAKPSQSYLTSDIGASCAECFCNGMGQAQEGGSERFTPGQVGIHNESSNAAQMIMELQSKRRQRLAAASESSADSGQRTSESSADSGQRTSESDSASVNDEGADSSEFDRPGRYRQRVLGERMQIWLRSRIMVPSPLSSSQFSDPVTCCSNSSNQATSEDTTLAINSPNTDPCGEERLTAPRVLDQFVGNRTAETSTFNCVSLWKNEDFTRCRGCAFTSCDIIAVTDFNQFAADEHCRSRICIFGPADEQTWQLLRSVECGHIGEPWDICYCPSSSSFLITDRGSNAAIKSIKVNSEYAVSVMNCPPREQPSGIALLKSGDLVITDTKKHVINKIGVHRREMNERLRRVGDGFGVHGDGQGEVLVANYVTVDHHDRIIISDSDNHVVKVFSSQGEELLKFSVSVFNGKDMIPQGLAVDEMNNIFVAEHSSNSVLKFSPDGMQIGEPLRMKAQPWGLSYCAERKRLAVTTDKALEVFQLL